jgi:hypothetical protein
MNCKCIDQCNAELKKMGENTQIDVPLMINFKTGKATASQCKIATIKLDSKNRKRAITLMAAFCPMCGKKYEKGKSNVGKSSVGRSKK